MTDHRPADTPSTTADHLRENDERLRLATDAVDIRSWEIDVPSGAFTWSDNEETIGFPIPDTVANLLEMVQPDDQSKVKQTFEQAINGGREFEITYLIAEAAGDDTTWLSSAGTAITTEDDSVERVVGVTQDITDQKQLTESLERLNDASRELMETDAEEITDYAVDITQDVLDVAYASLWCYDGQTGDLQLKMSSTAVGVAPDDIRKPDFAEHAWQTFISNEIDVSNDLPPAADITSTESPIRSRVIVPLGRHGVICAGAIPPAMFDDTMVDLAETVAATVETALDRADNEQQLEAQNTELTQLNQINDIIRKIDQGLVQAETREDIDRIVCERLSDTELYEFTWIGEIDPGTDTVIPCEWAGVDTSYLDALEITTDETRTGQGPVGTALRTREPQLVEDIVTDSRFVPWREQTLAQDVRSCLSVPLCYEDSLYGVLTVYSAQPLDDTGDEVLAELGETIGHAINAAETKRTLQTDSVVELGLQLREPDTTLSTLAEQAACTIEFEGFIPHADGVSTVFLTAHNISMEELQTAANGLIAVEALIYLSESVDECRCKARIDGPLLASVFIEQDAAIQSLTIEASTAHAVVTLSQAAAVRDFTESVQVHVPKTELVSRHTRERSLPSEQAFQTIVEEQLTDRQQDILQTAYRSGFFESPRETTGQEIAALLGVSQPTFAQHLRTSQRNLFGALFESTTE